MPCHYCNQAFASKEAEYDFQVVSYISIVAEAMGIHRRDKFKEYTHWKDLELILKDMEQNIETSVFEKEKIIEVLQAVFIP